MSAYGHGHQVPDSLRPIVLAARMRELIPPTRLTKLLGSFHPPIDPTSSAWTALCTALDAYDHAAQAHLDLDPARGLVISAALALRGPAGPFSTGGRA